MEYMVSIGCGQLPEKQFWVKSSVFSLLWIMDYGYIYISITTVVTTIRPHCAIVRLLDCFMNATFTMQISS